ncbi:daunorubicin resistance ABC transporter membrane protein [Sarcina ventriculi]|uniref:ABC transporter permease n=1 Tax=Sarcina ventriculi TaxID=1267 RepID=UPI000D967194|nr:ABC transporter permease [Sarcina ventriculi]SPZ49520.1 daunorubicin resistance ABC transporter membrane protein [Sarcina ventriculi]
MKNWFYIEKSIFYNWFTILDLSKKEFVQEFANARLGIIWAIIKPLVMIAVFCFVFSSGMRNITGDIQVPYLIWLVSAYIPWIFISDVIVSGASSIRSKSFLVKKIKFPVEILPNVRMFISFYTFLILLCITFIIFGVNGMLNIINYFKLIYAIIITMIFLSALLRLLATWVVMSIDILHAIGVIMQFLLWTCPIMWQSGELPIAQSMPWLNLILKINPLYYLVELFRDAFLGTNVSTLSYAIYFWIITLSLFIFSSKEFSRFRPEFDDVL